MMRRSMFMGAAALLVMWAVDASALSVSLADLTYPSFGRARHFSQDFEYLGNSRTSYDGVTFTTSGSLLNLSVRPTVRAPGSTGTYEWLSVWIDWDLSHTWDVSERVVFLEDQWFAFGTTTLHYALDIPEQAAIDSTWMRVRFTFDGAHGASGDLYTGEVEDYLLHSAPPPPPPPPPPPVPEPGSVALLATGGITWLAGILVRRRERRR